VALSYGDKTVVVDRENVDYVFLIGLAVIGAKEVIDHYYAGQKQLLHEKQKLLEQKQEVKT
jgi:hypothetical protein